MTWRTLPIRRVFSVVNGGTPTSDSANWEGRIAWATPVDVGRSNGRTISTTERTLTAAGLMAGSRAVSKGTLIVSSRAPIGYVAETACMMAFNQGCKGLEPTQAVDIRYFKYQLSVMADKLQSRGQGSTFLELSGDALASTPVVVPPTAEQRMIADYLDVETGRIDALISKKRRMIDLLAERRQALITSAVSGDMTLPNMDGTQDHSDQHTTPPLSRKRYRGQDTGNRDPSATRRGHRVIDGGTFKFARIGHVCATVLGKMLQRTPHAPGDQRVPYLRAGLLGGLSHVRGLPLMYATGREVQVYSLIEGDLIIAEGGDMGRSEFTPRLPERTIFQNSLHRIRLRSAGDIRFVRYALIAIHSSGILEALCNKATFGHLTVDKLRQLEIPWPQPSVQRALADYLDIETGRIDAIISKTNRMIDLLAERRQAVITAAVTGELAIPGVAA